MSLILDFYGGAGTDFRGRLLTDVWQFGFERLEGVHDYIQWLFPLRQASAFNPHAPILTDEDVAAFRASAALQVKLRKSLALMLDFYEFDFLSPTSITLKHPTAQPWWAQPRDHNLLRLTRILTSTRILGLECESGLLLAQLNQIGNTYRLPATTRKFWQDTEYAK